MLLQFLKPTFLTSASARMEQYDQHSLRMPVFADLEYLYTPRLHKLRLIGVAHG